MYWSLATFLFTIIYNHTEIEIQTCEPETTDVNEGTIEIYFNFLSIKLRKGQEKKKSKKLTIERLWVLLT